MCRFVITHKVATVSLLASDFSPFRRTDVPSSHYSQSEWVVRRTDVPSSHYSQSEWVVHGSDVMSLIKNSQLDALERHSASHTAYEAPDASFCRAV